MENHPYGWLSLLPPVVAIVMAIATRRVVVSLLTGVLLGGLILASWHPWQAVTSTLTEHLWATVVDDDKLHVFAFTAMMGAMVGIISRSGGMRGLVQVVSPLASNRRRGQLTTWVLGLFVFFDDYANTLLLGNTLRPLTDRLKISREKLAYLVDSTAAPVSGLAIVSTWVAGEIQFVQEGLDKLPADTTWTAMGLFLESIPYRFYVLWALLFVPLIALMGRDFGPMWSAERRRWLGEGDAGESAETIASPTDPPSNVPARWYNAVIPIVVTVAVIITIMYTTGRSSLAPDDEPTLGSIFGSADTYGSLLWGALVGALLAAGMVAGQKILTGRELISASSAGAAMMMPALVVLWFASSLSIMTGNKPDPADSAELDRQQIISQTRAETLASTGAAAETIAQRLVEFPAAIGAGLQAAIQHGADPSALALALAEQGASAYQLASWLAAAGLSPDGVEAALPGSYPREVAPIADDAYPFRRYRLYTGEYISQALQNSLAAPWLPTLIFVLSSFVAFATGTSWGTMGIVMPLAIPLVYGVMYGDGATPGAPQPIMLAAVGGVLAGAIFGDHCSPISDTTVLSSQASGCHHVAHVWTQLPYAVLVAVVTIVCGTIPIGFGVSVWITLPLGVAAMVVLLWMLGRPVEDA